MTRASMATETSLLGCSGNRLGLGRERLILGLTVVYIIGAHLRLSLYANGGILVPMYLMLAASGVMALWFAPVILRKIGGMYALLIGFVVLQPLAGGGAGYGASVTSILQLTASITGALAMIFALGLIKSDRLRGVLTMLWIVMIVLALAESLFLKGFFDQVRDWFYAGSGRFVYAAEDRDLQLYGRVRTTVFASEPSFLADTLSSLVVMVFMLDKQRGKWRSFLQLGAMLAISFFVVPSFKTGFYVAALMVWHFWPRNLREAAVLAMLLVGSLLMALVGAETLFRLAGETAGLHLSSGSFFGRIGSAHIVGFDALAAFPIYGFGIGQNDAVYDIIVRVWNESGAFGLFPWYGPLSAADLMSNGFWWMWIYLGLVGGAILLALTARLLRGVGVMTPWRSLVCACIVWYAGSAFVDPQSWYVVVIFSVGALAVRVPLLHGRDKGQVA